MCSPERKKIDRGSRKPIESQSNSLAMPDNL